MTTLIIDNFLKKLRKEPSMSVLICYYLFSGFKLFIVGLKFFEYLNVKYLH